MADYEKKESEILDKIAKTLVDLDNELSKIDALNEDQKEHHVKQWFAEKRALHDIKKIVHEAGKYEKYDTKELEKISKMFESLSQ